MVSHNLQQRGAAEAGDVKFAVEQRMGTALMLLQEVRNWPGGQSVLTGYELYTDVVINLRRRHHTSRIVIGCDLNVSLAPSLEGLTGSRIHSNANGAPSRWRGAVIEWMHSLRLRALCIFDQGLFLPHVEWDHDACWTHKNSNKGGLFQLDYLLF